MNDPDKDGLCLLLFVSTIYPDRKHDPACLLKKGDHPFLKHDSYVHESFSPEYAGWMSDSSRELWWTWYVSGYRGNRLISAKAVCGEDAEFIAGLFRRDGLRKIQVNDHSLPQS